MIKQIEHIGCLLTILRVLSRWCVYENGLDEDRPDPQQDQGDRHPHEPQALEADGQPGAGLGGDVPEASPALLLEGVALAAPHSILDYRDINTTYCPSAFLCFSRTPCNFNPLIKQA